MGDIRERHGTRDQKSVIIDVFLAPYFLSTFKKFLLCGNPMPFDGTLYHLIISG
jgi:hypothetical protein